MLSLNKYETLIKFLVAVDTNTRDMNCNISYRPYESEEVWYYEFRTESEDWYWFELKITKIEGKLKLYINSVIDDEFTMPQIKELCKLIEEKQKERDIWVKKQAWGSIGVLDM